MQIKKFFIRATPTIKLALVLLGAVLLFISIGTVIANLVSPLTTILFVLGGTLYASTKRSNAILALAGIVLYALSWPVGHAVSGLLGQLICLSGIVLWFVAIFRSAPENVRLLDTVVS